MRVALLIALLAATPVAADIRPVPRPTLKVEVLSTRGTTAAPEVTAVPESVRPVVRLTVAERAARAMMVALRAPEPLVDTEGMVRRSERPLFRPADLILAMGDSLRRGSDARNGGGGGGICGRASIRGEAIGTVRGSGGCGIRDAVQVTQVSGLGLTTPAQMDCGTARALDDWARNAVLPTIGRTGGGAVALETGPGYACRGRNGQSGARLSEHGKGKAIDIMGLKLANGGRIGVLEDWDSGANGRMLRALHDAACGTFGTVLGPEANAFHRNHFHFDTAAYRSGAYCR